VPPERLPPPPVAGKRRQRKPQDQPQEQGGDADQFLTRLRVHAVMRRSAYTGTTVTRSGWAQKVTSSPRPASTSWRAASLAAKASRHPPCWAARSRATCAASFRFSLRAPFFTALMRRPAV